MKKALLTTITAGAISLAFVGQAAAQTSGAAQQRYTVGNTDKNLHAALIRARSRIYELEQIIARDDATKAKNSLERELAQSSNKVAALTNELAMVKGKLTLEEESRERVLAELLTVKHDKAEAIRELKAKISAYDVQFETAAQKQKVLSELSNRLTIESERAESAEYQLIEQHNNSESKIAELNAQLHQSASAQKRAEQMASQLTKLNQRLKTAQAAIDHEAELRGDQKQKQLENQRLIADLNREIAHLSNGTTAGGPEVEALKSELREANRRASQLKALVDSVRSDADRIREHTEQKYAAIKMENIKLNQMLTSLKATDSRYEVTYQSPQASAQQQRCLGLIAATTKDWAEAARSAYPQYAGYDVDIRSRNVWMTTKEGDAVPLMLSEVAAKLGCSSI